jgi:DNA excision repair protein ERCC-2
MRLVTGQRSVVMSVGEFATFSPSPTGGSSGRSGAWRAAAGTAWHQTMRERTLAVEPGAQFEVSVQGRLLHKGWSVELQGRVDQIVPNNGGRILREIKTISESLPQTVEELEHRYPEYFRQLAVYLQLSELGGRPTGTRLTGELVFVDFSTGIMQTAPLPLSAVNGWIEPQLNALTKYWEFRWNSRQRLTEMPKRSAFAVLRPGQAEAQADLAAIAGHSGVFMFEAPTGFGKTGLLLEYALARLREGHAQRLLYLTGKGTGQGPVIHQLRALLGDEPELRFIQLRSRAEHAIESPLHTCDVRRSCREELEARWQAAGLDTYTLFEDGSLPVEKSRRLGAATGVCPYEITRAALPCAEVWVCDYNYVFSPAHRGVLSNLQGFDPMSTLLLLDEAHNLPARAAEARSHTFSAHAAAFAAQALHEVQARPVLQRAAEDLADFLEKLVPTEKLDATASYILEDNLEKLAAEMIAAPVPEQLPEAVADFLWSSVNALETLHDQSLLLLPTVPTRGELRLACVDAAPAIAAALRSFGQAVLTSATFGPPEFFASACGLDKGEAHWIAAHAPWRDGAYDVAVDARIDTRLRSREHFYSATAETVRLLADGQAKPVAVFFPSYDYAETIRTYVEAMDPGLRINMQPRGASLAERTEFLDESLLTAHAIFLVLGGSFAEGIDRLGGEVERALVVGPALPEPNAVKKAQLARYEETMAPDEAFRRAYLAPGLLKVAQALGRLVRAPGQRAKVLLHCRRFAEAATQMLLPEEYRTGVILRKDTDLLEWLKK